MDERTDRDLVELARAGNRRAFGELVGRYQPMAGRVAIGVVRSDDVARELANEAMLWAYLSLDRLRDPGRFQSWLYGIVLNVCRGYLRERDAAPLSLEVVTGGLRFDALSFTGVEPDPQEAAEAQELHRLVLSAVDALSPKNRSATLLYYYDQLSVREIAATLGTSVAAVKGRLHKSRGRLGEILLPVVSVTRAQAPEAQRRREMVKVTIADVVQRRGNMCVVVLFDEAGRSILPVWVGGHEAAYLAAALGGAKVPRPLTPMFVADVLEAAGGGLEEVRIEELRDDTFYAVARIRAGDTVREVDARPSDAMSLAAVTGSPIYVADEIMEKAGHDVPQELAAEEPKRKGIEAIAQNMAKEPGHPHASNLMAYVFGKEE